LRELNGRLRSPDPESRFWLSLWVPFSVIFYSRNVEWFVYRDTDIRNKNLIIDYAAVERYQVVLQQYKRATETLSSLSRSIEAEMRRTTL
jgi:hypothetical protein